MAYFTIDFNKLKINKFPTMKIMDEFISNKHLINSSTHSNVHIFFEQGGVANSKSIIKWFANKETRRTIRLKYKKIN